MHQRIERATGFMSVALSTLLRRDPSTRLHPPPMLLPLTLLVLAGVNPQKPITSESIKDLAGKLRDASLSTSIEKSIPLREFSNHRGYYFVASDAHFIGAKVNSFKQIIEGAMYESECLVNFTLLTNDASSVNAQQIVNALSELQLTPLPDSVRPLPQGAR